MNNDETRNDEILEVETSDSHSYDYDEDSDYSDSFFLNDEDEREDFSSQDVDEEEDRLLDELVSKLPHIPHSANSSKRYDLNEILSRKVDYDSHQGYKKLYEYILWVTDEGHLTSGVTVSKKELQTLLKLCFDQCMNRVIQIVDKAKNRIEKASPEFSFKKYLNLLDLKDKKTTIFNYKDLRTFALGPAPSARLHFGKHTFRNFKGFSSSMDICEQISYNPSVFFDFLSDLEIVELQLLYKLSSLCHPFGVKLSEEILFFDFTLENRSFFAKVVSEALKPLHKNGYVPSYYSNTIESSPDDFINVPHEFIKRKNQGMSIGFNEFHVRADFHPLIHDVGEVTFFESQFSLFIILAAYNIDFKIIYNILFCIYSPLNIRGLSLYKCKYMIMKLLKRVEYDSLDDKKPTECGICFDTFKTPSTVIQMECNHIFHSDCLKYWVTKFMNCPFCKHKVYPIVLMKKDLKHVKIDK